MLGDNVATVLRAYQDILGKDQHAKAKTSSPRRCTRAERGSGKRAQMLRLRLHLGIAKVGHERLQHPEDIAHVALFQFCLHLQLLSGGVLLQHGHVEALDKMHLCGLFLQRHERV